MRTLKLLSFGLLAVVVTVLAVLSVCGRPVEAYSSWWMTLLWASLAATASIYIIRKRLYRRTAVLLLHLSFIVILVGALVTHCLSSSGEVRLTAGQEAGSYAVDGGEAGLPFVLRLVDFEMETYPGTPTPRDFISHVEIVVDGRTVATGDVSMNKVLEQDGYRFYQSKYDPDDGAVTLAVYRDPAGIAITYAGYLLFMFAGIILLFSPSSRFRTAVKRVSRKAAVMAAGVCCALSADAGADRPDALPAAVVARLGEIPVFYKDRIAPLSTMAVDFTAGLCGSASYRGLTAEQVFGGFVFDFSAWKDEPIIKIKNAGMRDILGIDGNRASYDDFAEAVNYGRLDVDDLEVQRRFAADIAKYEGINMLVSGSLLRLFPVAGSQGAPTVWYSPVDRLPFETDDGKWLFVRKYLGYVNERMLTRDYDEVVRLFDKLEEYQSRETDSAIPARWVRKVEAFYNKFCRVGLLGGFCLAIGFVMFVAFCAVPKVQRKATALGLVVAAIAWLATSLLIAMRWTVSGHVPLSNGFETMQFMSWCSLSATLLVSRRWPMSVPFGLIVGGLTLLVASMSGSGSSVTPLMPVLSSPLLSIHVAVIMISYSLLAFMMLNGVMALFVGRRPDGRRRQADMAEISRVMLYPAVVLLGAGIFIGAVWANVSWGRYWGWDPKEVWALITMIVYSFALHSGSLRFFDSPKRFHWFCIVAFVSVMVTYFGVNFFLGGLHSYA